MRMIYRIKNNPSHRVYPCELNVGRSIERPFFIQCLQRIQSASWRIQRFK
jgi:hypothetical protein